MLYVGLCRDYYYGDILYVVDDIDCMSEGLLSFPGLEKKETESPLRAAREYVEAWDLVDAQSPPLHITVNTSLVYWEGQAKTVDQLKAISLNVMHENLSTTDGIYGIFHERDVEARIRALGSAENGGMNGLGATDQAAVIEQLTEILHKLRNGNGGG